MIALINKIRRHWKVALSYSLGLSRSISGPINVHIEVTNICNFHCVYCPQSKPDEHFKSIGRGKMSLDSFKIIIDKVVNSWSIQEIVLTRDGEPLIHPELDQFIAYANQKGLQVSIGSNGSYFTPDRVELLIESGLKKVKGDFCANKKKYEKLRAGGNWEEVLKGYRNLLDYAVAKNKKFHLTLVDLNTYNLNSKDEVETSISEIYKLFPYSSSYLSINPAIMHNSFDGALVTFSSSAQLKKQKFNLCHHPWIEFVIDYKGNAVGCCRDLRSEYILGNVLEEDSQLDEIWNGPKMRYLRQQLVKKSPESINTCHKCDLPYGTSYAGSGHFTKLFRYLKR